MPFTPLTPMNTASAADCEDSACIDVYTQDGQIIIEGKKGSGPKAKAIPKVQVRAKAAPKANPKALSLIHI